MFCSAPVVSGLTTGSREIRGKILGIVGYGHIGSQLGIIAERTGDFSGCGASYRLACAESAFALKILLEDSDVVSLHVPVYSKPAISCPPDTINDA
jgi:phosphoglycerate dehydrogenase-like enzyme